MRTPLRPGALRVVLTAALIAGTAAIAPLEAAKSYSAERFDSRVRVMAGGAVEVTETVAFRFESGTFDHVFRDIPVRRTDGIEIVAASLDGRPFPIGDGVNHIQVTGSSKMRVLWRFQPLADSTHVFVLTYVARGVVTQGADADVVAWRALPTEHAYRIAAATVEFEFPAALSGGSAGVPAPKMEWHRVDGPVDATVRRAAEDTAAAPVVARATASGVRANGWIEARFDMARGSILTAPPAWQRAQQSAQALAPRWMTAALLISMAGLIVLFGLRQQYDPPRRDQLASRTSMAAPDSLPPGWLEPCSRTGASQSSMRWRPSSRWQVGESCPSRSSRGFLGQPSFSIRPLPTKAPLSAHERALLSITLDETKIGQATSLTAAKRRLVRRFRQFSAAMREDLSAAGLIDQDRKRIRDRYVRISVAMLILSAIALAVAGMFLVSRYGAWSMLIPAALAVTAMSAMIFAAATTPLSNEGLRRAAGWRGFREYLKALTQDRQPAPSGVEAFLPFAVATGLAAGWAKYVKRHPNSVPAWFRALSAGSRERAFTAFVMSAGAHGAHGAGGAAGGGASGAG